jgi:hypothetical protein
VLHAVPNSPGLYQGLYTPTASGRYEVTAAEDDQAFANKIAFDVTDASVEQSETAMQKDSLEQLARVTGGRYLSLRDLPLLPEIIDTKPAINIVHKEIELWDHWLPLALFVALTCIEWAWRRKKNLA